MHEAGGRQKQPSRSPFDDKGESLLELTAHTRRKGGQGGKGRAGAQVIL
jgi:hypothetical protein